jgi:poly(3-hydroxybutyrate) depolymerase
MKPLVFLTLIASSFVSLSQDLTLQKTASHPMQYYVSLPKGWTKTKAWPVVVVLEAAEKEYKQNAERFVAARNEMPFIIVAPFNTNNGNQGRRDPKLFPYSNETWDYIDKVGDCQFNDEGIEKIIQEVAAKYNGEKKVYITGFEAGTHVLWSIVLNHPQLLNAAASVAGNFRNRCVEVGKISNDQSRKKLPIKSFVGDADEYFGPSGKLYNQWTEVKSIAIANGFENISETIISKKSHEPMPAEVLNYFFSLLK